MPCHLSHTAGRLGIYGGGLFDLLNPAVDAIDFGVIAEALCKVNRFTGHTHTPYSVAQHSLVVADQLPPELRIYGLLHDAHEAFTGDITTPMKCALRALGMGDALALLQSNLDAAIFRAAVIQPPAPGIVALIKRADLIAAKSEARDLIPNADPEDFGPGPMLPFTIKPMAWDRAHERYSHALESVGLNPRRRAA